MYLEAGLHVSISVMGGASFRGTMAGWELSLKSSGSSCTHMHTHMYTQTFVVPQLYKTLTLCTESLTGMSDILPFLTGKFCWADS